MCILVNCEKISSILTLVTIYRQYCGYDNGEKQANFIRLSREPVINDDNEFNKKLSVNSHKC